MSSVLELGGVSKAGKARERGVQKLCQSGDRGVLSKGGNKHMRTLNNTEWGGGGGGPGVSLVLSCLVLYKTPGMAITVQSAIAHASL